MTVPFMIQDQTPAQRVEEAALAEARLAATRAEFDRESASDQASTYKPGDEPPAWMVMHMINFLRALKSSAEGRMYVASLNNEQRPANAPWEKKWKAHELLIDPDGIGAPMELSAFVRRHGTADRGIFLSPQPVNHEVALANQAAAEKHNEAEATRKKANPKHKIDRWSKSLRQKGFIAAIGSICLEVDFKHHKANLPEDVLNRTQNGFIDGPLCPSVVNLSPGGPHIFLLLDEPLEATAENLARVEAITARTCDLYGADPGATDCGHLLRMPYTFNTKAGHVAKNGGPVLIMPKRFDLARRENIENIEAALEEDPDGLYSGGEWSKPTRTKRQRQADGATVDNPFTAYARCHVSVNPAAILATVDGKTNRDALLRAVGHFAWCGAGEDATAAFLAAWAARLSKSRGLGWDPHGKHLDEHMKQFRSDAARAARHGRDLGAERARFVARWGAGVAGVDAYVNDRAALALEEIGAAVAAGEDAEAAAKSAAALRELFNPQRAAKPDAELSKQERRGARLDDLSQTRAAKGCAERIETRYAGEVAFDSDRGAWVDTVDDGKRDVWRESVIYDETDPASVARAAEAALMRAQLAAPKALGEHFFEFGKSLVRIDIGRAPASRGAGVVAALAEVERPLLIGRLGAVATFRPRMKNEMSFEDAESMRQNAPAGKEPSIDVPQPIAPPPGIADNILASRGVRPFPRISGLRTCPTIRHDGSILSEDGLDNRTGTVLVSSVDLPPMIAEPNLADAKDAAAQLADLFSETKFEQGSESVGLAVAISGILTAVGRPAMDFVPIHAATSPTPGSGKGFTHEVVSLIANGAGAASVNVAATIDETEKRITGLLLAGYSSIVLDNANGILASDLLAQVASQGTIVTRPLGASTMVQIDNATMVFVNGNNLRLADDLTRRAVMAVIDTGEERPERRQFKRDTLAMIRTDRGKYVAAALTVLRAFILAKGKGDACSIEQRLSGFGQWSDLVRSALVWCGYADPAASMDRIRESDPVHQSLVDILPAWHDRFGAKPLTVSEMIAAIAPVGGYINEDDAALAAAFRNSINHAGQKDLDGRRVGMLLQRCRNRIAAGFKLTMVTKTTRSNKTGHSWRVAPPNWVEEESAAPAQSVEEERAAPAQSVVVPLKSKAARF